MWPTFDSLLFARDQVAVVCRLSGRVLRDIGLNATVVPTPTCGRAGDMQVIVFTVQTNGTPTYDPTIFGTTPGKFTLYSRGVGSATNTWVAARELTSTSDPDFYISQASGSLVIKYLTFILRNTLSPNDPITSVVATKSSNNSAYTLTNNGSGHIRPFGPSAVPAKPGDAVMTTAINNDAVGVMSVPTEADDVLYSDLYEDANVTPYNLGAVVQRNAPATIRLTAGGISGWTENAIESAGTGAGMPRYQQTTANARHGIYQDIELVAGRTYVLMADLWNVVGGSGSSGISPMLSVVAPSTTEHGWASNSSGNSLLAFGDTTQYDYGQMFFTNRSGSFACGRYLLFDATETGTHRFWISFGRQDAVATAPGSFTYAGSTSYDFTFGGLDIFELPAGFDRSHWALPAPTIGDGGFDTTYAANLLAPRQVNDASAETASSQVHEISLVLNSGGARPPNRMVPTHGWRRVVRYDADGLGQSVDNSVPMTGTSTWRAIVNADHVVSRRNGDQIYYEFVHTVHTVGVGCGFVVAGERGYDAYFNNTARNSTSLVGSYMAWSDGEYRAWSAAGGTGLTAWADGDVIGVLLDFTNSQIVWSVNGTVWATLAFQLDADLHSAFIAAVNGASNTSNNSVHRHDLNLTGPFSYKPVGAVAYDFDNEVS